MTIANWILLGTLIVTAGLLILSYIKKITLLKKICECIIIPLFGTLDILLLKVYLPDSLHLMKVTIIALSLVTISTIFLSFEKIRILRVFGRIFVISSILCWVTLFRTVFFIYRVPLWLILLMSTVYLAGMIIAIILSGKQEIVFYILFAFSFALSSYFNFCSLVFLCFDTKGSSILFFAGTTVFLTLTAFHFINQAKLKFKHAGQIRFSLLVASQILIACSNILMIAG